ncbi:MAG: NAD-glutamate dehydrogenase, partial [Chromatiales bacterium]
PDEEALAERQAAGQGLTRPEIAVLVSYAKHTLYQELLGSDLAEDPCLVPELERYFPRPLRERFGAGIQTHRLRREILASSVANRLVNRTGSTFVFRLQEELGVDAAAAVRAYIVAWEVFGLRRLWSAVAELDTRVPDPLQRLMLSSAARLMARTSRWLLKNGDADAKVVERIERYRGRVQELGGRLPELVDEGHQAALEESAAPLREAGVPEDLAVWVAGFDLLSRAFDLVDVADACAVDVGAAAQAYFAMGAVLELDWLATRIHALPTQDRWLAEARAGFRDELLAHHRSLCIAVLTGEMPEASGVTRLEAWRTQHQPAVDSWLRLLAELNTQDEPDLAMLSVALRAVQRLAASAVREGLGRRQAAGAPSL